MAFSFEALKKRFSSGASQKAKAEAPKMTAQEEAVDLAKTVVIAVGIALVLRIIIFQPFNIPSGSMRPNLLVGDFLVVSKPTYGYSRASLIYPATRMNVDGRVLGRLPGQGEVAVFKNRRDGNKDYIKRVIGLPGDRIQMIGGVLHLNGTAVEKEFIGIRKTKCGPNGGRVAEVPHYRETLPSGVTYVVQECRGDKGGLDNTGVYVVPSDHFFMMGDNRDESSDSRVSNSVGYIHKDDMVGKAERLFLSVDGEKSAIWEIWKWPFAIRYGRVFDPVQ